MTFDFSCSHSASSNGFTVNIYPQHVKAATAKHTQRKRWFVEIYQGDSLIRFPQPFGTDGLISKIFEFGMDASSMEWLASPCDATGSSPWKSKLNERNCVYFVLAVGANRVKIGWAKSLRSRYETLVSASPFPLEILWTTPGARPEEKMMHRKFAQYRICNEWSTYSNEIREFILENIKTRT